jgi:type II secretory pathway component PulF
MEALSLVHADAQTAGQRNAVETLVHAVRNGLPLSTGFSVLPRTYSKWHVQLIAVGERTGTLPDTLAHLADILGKKTALRRSVIGSLAYPALILCGTIVIAFFLLFYAFPKILPIFRGLHVALPASTRALILLLQVSTGYGLYILLATVCACAAAALALRKRAVRSHVDPFLLSTPFIGACLRNYCLASMFRSLHVLLKSGVRLDTSLSLTRESVWHVAYQESLAALEKGVLSGVPCTTHMRQQGRLYPPVTIELLSAGERTGTLTESALIVAELAEDELRQQLKNGVALLEPVLMVLMGAVVGFVALAIISPMYALTQSLSVQ